MTDEPLPAPVSPDAELGRRLRALRERQGMSLRELARRLKVSAATLSLLERGRVGFTLARLTQLAQVFGVPVADLVDVDSPTPGACVHQGGPADSPAVGEAGAPVAQAPAGDWRSFSPMRLEPPLAAALDAFLELGYVGASVRDIARRCHLSVPGLYHHYASKQEMLAELLRLYLESLLSRTAAARATGADPVTRFALIIECLVLHHTHRRALAFVGLSELRHLQPVHRERIAQLRRRQQRMVDAEVAAAHQIGRFTTPYPHEAARAVVTMCTAIPQWYREDGADTPEQIAQRHVRLALDLMRYASPSHVTHQAFGVTGRGLDFI